MSTIHTLDGSEPHESYGGWENFLTDICEVREEVNGVTYYGVTNCNYIVFPDGTLVENFGYHGRSLMNRIREEGAEVVLTSIKANHAKIRRLLDALKFGDQEAIERELAPEEVS